MIPITKPTLPDFSDFEQEFREFFSTGMLTNHKQVQALEHALQHYLGVKHVVAVSSCTSGLMLSLRALGLRGEVIIPSFTFSASGHALLWNGLTPKFVDVDPHTFAIDPKAVRKAITPRTTAILAVHIFGHPAPVHELEKIAKEHNLKLLFDAAHAMGAELNGKKIGGFGDVEVFSCSPTKLMVAGEGGIVATNNEKLANFIRIGRNYGDPGDYNCAFPGLNARMPEFNALLCRKSLEQLDTNVQNRQKLVTRYKQELANVTGISFQKIQPGCLSTFKDFALIIDPATFGLSRDQLVDNLSERGIQAKKYFFPPLHEQTAYHSFVVSEPLDETLRISYNTLSLPLYSHMDLNEVRHVTQTMRELQIVPTLTGVIE